MKLYTLYDAYETETKPGELICTSDDYAEIKAAARCKDKELSQRRERPAGASRIRRVV